MRLLCLLLTVLVPASFANWELVWSDEFDKDGLPDPQKWTYEEGFVRNKEDQYYTRGRLQNARVENGHLVIEARREELANPKFIAADHPNWQKNREKAQYTSACLVTSGLASWTYGKLVIRARLPMGTGAWPAFWMMGTNFPTIGWPKCGEIDIMEHVTSEKGIVHGTTHWFLPGGGPYRSDSQSFKTKNETLGDWHTYGIEWDERQIVYFFDGKEYGRFDLSKADGALNGQNPFRQPFFLMINLAVGGAWGGPPDEKQFPQQLLVDYVRVYQKTGMTQK